MDASVAALTGKERLLEGDWQELRGTEKEMDRERREGVRKEELIELKAEVDWERADARGSWRGRRNSQLQGQGHRERKKSLSLYVPALQRTNIKEPFWEMFFWSWRFTCYSDSTLYNSFVVFRNLALLLNI